MLDLKYPRKKVTIKTYRIMQTFHADHPAHTDMLTKIISLKDYRQNITKLWKEAHSKNIRYIVLHHSKPILEVKPYSEEIIFNDPIEAGEWKKEEYYQYLNEKMADWLDPADDDIFENM